MKNPGIFALLMLTVLFVGLTCGFFVGRNLNHSDVQLIFPTEAPTAAPSPTAAPTLSTLPDAASDATVAPSGSALININTATAEQLQTPPGIGEQIAQNIIAYRTEHGPFRSVSQLLNVELIGEKRLEAIRDLITV